MRNNWIKYVLFSSLIGIIAETGAYVMNLWVLNPWWFFIPWGIIWEGLCFGTLAYSLKKLHPIIQYGISATFGGLGEIIAAWIYPLWIFPNNKLLFINGLLGIVITLTIIWGTYCPLLNIVAKRIFRIDEK